jgi:hypothetical protein
MLVTLTYTSSIVNEVNVGQLFNYWRYRPTAVEDIDPRFLTGSLSGFVELSGFYRRYIVLHFEVIVDVANNETFPVTLVSAPSDIDLSGSIATAANALNISEFPLARRVVLSAKGGQDRAHYVQKIDCARLSGQPGAYRNSLQYSSLTTGIPPTNLWYNFATITPANQVNGVYAQITFVMRVLFTQRQTPNL